MENLLSLNQIEPGQCAIVKQLKTQGGMRQRFLDIGLTTGTKIECVGRSPGGNPSAYLIRGAVIAIRGEDCADVFVTLCGEKKGMRDRTLIAFAGNPNVGKSTVFNALTGMHQHTGNWQGKTVACAKGSFASKHHLYTAADLPGTYSLMTHAAEEEAAGAFLRSKEADIVVVICDATCLERNLNLVLQIMEISEKVVVCVNMMDEAVKKGISIDLPKLSKLLGVPVIGITARKKNSLRALLTVLDEVTEGKRSFVSVKSQTGSTDGTEEEAAVSFVERAEKICSETVCFHKENYQETDRKLDRILTGRLVGYPLMLALLMLVFWITITGANYPSEVLSGILFAGEKPLMKWCCLLGMPVWLREALVLGAYRVLAWVVSVMLPPMAIFFPLFTLLEDAGYLPRVAYNLDKTFKRCHACGKQALTMCMGFGCNAAGVIGCRIIDSPRERLLAVLTNVFVPCNGRFPTLIAVLTMFFAGTGGGRTSSFVSAFLLTAVIVFGICMTFIVTKLLSVTLLKGTPSSFTLELPPYRKPQIGRVLVHSVFDRTIFVLGRAVAAAIPAGLVIWIMANVTVGGSSILNICAGFLEPFAGLMGLDGVILMAFILGLPANEIVVPIILMAYTAQGSISEAGSLTEMKNLLTVHGWTWITAGSMILFSLVHWPCATTLLTIRKETGSLKWTALAVLIPTAAGILLCLLFCAVAKLFA